MQIEAKTTLSRIKLFQLNGRKSNHNFVDIFIFTGYLLVIYKLFTGKVLKIYWALIGYGTLSIISSIDLIPCVFGTADLENAAVPIIVVGVKYA